MWERRRCSNKKKNEKEKEGIETPVKIEKLKFQSSVFSLVGFTLFQR